MKKGNSVPHFFLLLSAWLSGIYHLHSWFVQVFIFAHSLVLWHAPSESFQKDVFGCCEYALAINFRVAPWYEQMSTKARLKLLDSFSVGEILNPDLKRDQQS